MVPVAGMCRKHLLGEHVELHMIAACMRRKMRLDGYFEKNCIEPRAVKERHDEIAAEMQRRGYDHRTPLRQPGVAYLRGLAGVRVRAKSSLADLMERCPECRAGMGRM